MVHMTEAKTKRSTTRGALRFVAVVGPAYFALVVFLLSVFDPDYNAITQVASDYGVGRFALVMNSGFLVAGVALIAFAFGFALQSTGVRSRAGSLLFVIAGSVLMMDSFFTTDLEGTPQTLHGLIHGFGGFFFFLSAPMGLLLVTSRLDRRRFLIAVTAVIISFASLVLNAALSVGAGGLAERIVIELLLSSVVYAAFGLSSQ